MRAADRPDALPATPGRAALLGSLAVAFMTGRTWESLLVAVLFATHPLNIESVAWVAERKSALSALFWMLSVLAYAWHARRPSARRMGLVAVSLGLGLANIPVSVLKYVVKFLFPQDLAMFYPFPGHLPAWRAAEALYRARGQEPEADRAADRAREVEAHFARAFAGIGREAMAAGKPESAVCHWLNALEIAPWSGEYAEGLAGALRAAGRAADVESVLESMDKDGRNAAFGSQGP